MQKPDWQRQHLDSGVQREPSPDGNRIILWLPVTVDGGARQWERISNVPGAEVVEEAGVAATAATAIRAQPPSGGLLGKLLQKLRKSSDAPTWILPSGDSAQQIGERQIDLLLVWSDPVIGALAEAALSTRWPNATRRQRLGSNLFLVGGIEPPRQESAAPKSVRAPLPPAVAPTAPGGNPREQAEHLLAIVRQAGDRQREAAVLADLGVACQRGGDAKSAVPHLEAALALARELGDQALVSDVLGTLGLALAALGQPARAVELIEQGLAAARASGDRFQIKAALDTMGQAYAAGRAPRRALAAFDEALTLARAAGDRSHQADMLWCCAIQHAELGDRAQALGQGREAIGIYQQLNHPSVAMLTEQLQKYASGAEDARLPAADPGGAGVVVGGWSTSAPAPGAGPGLLRMAYTAVKSMAKFVGSGMKTVAPAVREERLRTCASCEHHTGVRCKLCGCFTSVKTWLPHEQCPLEKWPK